MESAVLVIHLILALALIGIVLMQRSEGGGLSASNNVMSGRGAATALTRATWIIAGLFIVTSVALTIIAAENSRGASVMDQPVVETAPADLTPTTPDLTGGLLPGASGGDAAPIVPAPAN